MKLIKYILILSFFLIPACQGEDITGKIVIEYDNDWSAVITLNNDETNITETGTQEFVYKNPDYLKVVAAKQDSSLDKITVYIYEDNRIVAGDTTRDPEGTVTANYEYPY